MKKLVVEIMVICFLAILSIILIARSVQAGGGCVPVYGGGEVCPRVGEVLLEKKVRNPATGLFVDNLGLSDPKYRPLQIVTFQIIVQNSGESTFDKVVVKDKIPNFIDYMSISGSTTDASYDGNTRLLTFSVANLSGGSKEIFTVKARAAHQAALPAEKSPVCPVNVVDATSDSQSDHAESQFCIEKEMVVPTVPAAGPEHWILATAGLTITLLTGFYLRKKAAVILR